MCEYLEITIHDNDFSEALRLVGKHLYQIFSETQFPNNEKDLESIKPLVTQLLDVSHRLYSCSNKSYMKYFDVRLKLKFVDFTDIPDWNNYESIYIPLFKYDINKQPKIILR